MIRRLVPLSLLLFALIAGVTWALYARSPRPAGVLHDLARARPERAFPARLSVATEYRPCTRVELPDSITVPREDCGEVGDMPLKLEHLAAAGERLAPDSLQASALTAVLWWDGQQASLDKTILRLSDALRLEGDSVPLLVDLSAVHLFRAQETQNPLDLVVSLNYAHDALAIEPRDPSALFNAALASEALYLVDSADSAWTAYLGVDGRSRWADEARERRRALRERPPVLAPPTVSSSLKEVEAYAARHPQEARQQGWHDVLGAWGRAVLGDSTSRADSLLALASRLGVALAGRPGGDASLKDAVEAIRVTANDSAATDRLARAHAAYGYGQVHIYRHRETAPDSLSRVLDLEPPSPALVAWAHASSPLTMASLRAGGPPEAGYRTLLARIDTARYPALAARVHWMWGKHLLDGGDDLAGAEMHLARAARTYQRLGEWENYGATRSMEGSALYRQGDTLALYRMAHQAATALRHHRESLRLHNVLRDLAGYAGLDGIPSAAFVLQDEGVAVAGRVSANPWALPEALLSRAQFYMVKGDTGRADADLDSATVRFQALEDSDHAELLIHTRAVVGNRPAAEVDSAVRYFSREYGNSLWQMIALMRRADLRLSEGDLDGAAIDLDSLTAQTERASKRGTDYHLRSALIEQARSRFDQLVMLHARAGRPLEALRALERGRVPFMPGTDARAAPGDRLRGPEGQVVLEYALIGDRLLAWTIRGGSVALDTSVVDRDSLVFAIERAGWAVEAERDDVAEPLLERLHGWLMGPVLERLHAGARLVIVADGEIGRVPFPAMRDVLDNYTLSSVSSLTEAGRRAPADRSAPRALLVADPAFDRGAHPTLNALDSARAEMAALRAIYDDADTLSGGNASIATLRARASRADVIHYAGHAVFDDTRPNRSFLVLAGKDRLPADTVSQWELDGVRLVVLSACSTIRARHGRSGGFAGLSGAFLSAGAGGVVGSLWKVDDGDARRLMEAFHREYEASRDPAAALRTAQRQMRDQGRPIAAWAGFRYVGG